MEPLGRIDDEDERVTLGPIDVLPGVEPIIRPLLSRLDDDEDDDDNDDRGLYPGLPYEGRMNDPEF